MSDIYEDMMNDIFDSGLLSEEEINNIFGEIEGPVDEGYRATKEIYYTVISKLAGADTIDFKEENINLKNIDMDDKIATVKFTIAKSVDIDESVLAELNTFAKMFNTKYSEYRELLPEDITADYFNDKNIIIDDYKKAVIGGLFLIDKTIVYYEDDVLGDMRKFFTWKCKITDDIITKEKSIEIFNSLKKQFMENLAEAKTKEKEEQEFKEV
jgi:hypothetical protein